MKKCNGLGKNKKKDVYAKNVPNNFSRLRTRYFYLDASWAKGEMAKEFVKGFKRYFCG